MIVNKSIVIGLAIAPSINADVSKISIDSELVEITIDEYGYEDFNSIIYLPKSSLIYIEAPFINLSLNNTNYYWVKDWSDKPFPRNTLMFIGSGVRLRPCMFVRICVYAEWPDWPTKIDVYFDGNYYDTITGEHYGPINIYRYPLDYYEKGFHTLTYVPDEDNSSSDELDVQIGFRGFIKHILPYLMK